MLYNSSWQTFPEFQGGAVIAIAEAGKGGPTDEAILWMNTEENGVWTYDGYCFKPEGLDEGLGTDILATQFGTESQIYASKSTGIFRWSSDGWKSVFPDVRSFYWGIQSLDEDTDGTIWAASLWGAFRISGDGQITLFTVSPIAKRFKSLFPWLECVVVQGNSVASGKKPGLGLYLVKTDPFVNDALVLGVLPGSPAARAGIRVGDRILSISGAGAVVDGTQVSCASGTDVELTVAPFGIEQQKIIRIQSSELEGAFNILRLRSVCRIADGKLIFSSHSQGVLLCERCVDGQIRFSRKGSFSSDWHGCQQIASGGEDGSFYYLDEDGIYHCQLDSDAPGKMDVQLEQDLAEASVLLRTKDGGLWTWNIDGLHVRRNGEWVSFPRLEWCLPLVQTRDGAVWFGGYKLRRIQYENPRVRKFTGLTYMTEEPDGRKWFLTNDGQVVSKSNGTWLQWSEKDGVLPFVMLVFKDWQGEVWALGAKEKRLTLARLDENRWELMSQSSIPHLENLNLVDLKYCLGDDKRFYFALSRPGQYHSLGWGLVAFSPTGSNAGEWENYGDVHSNCRYIHGVSNFPDGRIWVQGTQSQLLDPRAAEFEPFNSPCIRHLNGQNYQEHMRGVWFQSANEEWVFYDGVNKLKTLPLPSSFLLLPKPLLVQGNRAWALTLNDRLAHYNGRWWAVFPPQLGVNQGISDKWLNCRSICRTKNGVLWLNCGAFMVRYQPDLTPPETIASIPDQVGYRQSVLFSWDGVDRWNLSGVDDLSFSYRLDDGDWTEPTRHRQHVFSGLSPGNHWVEVRAIDGDMNADPTPVRLHLSVQPPVWRQPWFLVLLGIMALVLLGTFFYSSHQRIARLRVEKQQEHEMREFESMKLRLFTGITHDLRTPLTLILGPLERMMTERGMDQRLPLIYRNAQRLLQTVNGLMDLRKLDEGGGGLDLSRADLVEFCRGIVESFSDSALQQEVLLSFDTDLELLSWVFDADKLDKILVNLLANAIRYAAVIKDKERWVVLRLWVENENACGKDFVNISVEDNGPGIPVDDQAHIFERFYQVKQKVNKTFRGSGIGLAVVKELVTVHHGIIHVESDPTVQGTRFQIKLPALELYAEEERRQQGSLDNDQLSSSFDVEENPAWATEKPTILLVEDSADVREFIRSELKEKYVLLEAEDGESGLQIAYTHEIDLVISDVMMGGMDGFSLCRKLKTNEATCHLPVILLTARGALEAKEEGLSAGADDYITKPFQMSLLEARIHNLLKLRKQLHSRFVRQHAFVPETLSENSMDQAFLRRVMDVMEEHMDDSEFGVADLLERLNVGSTYLHTKLKALTGENASGFMRSIRLKTAARYLAGGQVTVGEAAARVGMLNHSYFTRCFRQMFGVPPSKYYQSLKEEEGD